MEKETYTIPLSVLNEIIEYIEDAEVKIEGEWGTSRSLEELIRDNEMPDLYNHLIAIRDKT